MNVSSAMVYLIQFNIINLFYDYPQGLPVTEATRARGLNRIHVALNDDKLYQFSNNMTSTQYKKPVTSIYGSLLREQVYGVNTQRNKHGFMGFHDYYF